MKVLFIILILQNHSTTVTVLATSTDFKNVLKKKLDKKTPNMGMLYVAGLGYLHSGYPTFYILKERSCKILNVNRIKGMFKKKLKSYGVTSCN